jgi:hypothetical protein
MEGCDPAFGLVEKIRGPNNSFLSHIESTSSAKVVLKGFGSGSEDQFSKGPLCFPLFLFFFF